MYANIITKYLIFEHAIPFKYLNFFSSLFSIFLFIAFHHQQNNIFQKQNKVGFGLDISKIEFISKERPLISYPPSSLIHSG